MEPSYDLGDSFRLNYYPGRYHSIGIDRVGLDHVGEFFLESIDGGIRGATGYDNVIYDMHGRNTPT
jgi:hypothetical protein